MRESTQGSGRGGFGDAEVDGDRVCEKTIKWQQRLLSPREVARLRAAPPAALTPLEEEYREAVTEADLSRPLDDPFPGSRIYTLTARDVEAVAAVEARFDRTLVKGAGEDAHATATATAADGELDADDDGNVGGKKKKSKGKKGDERGALLASILAGESATERRRVDHRGWDPLAEPTRNVFYIMFEPHTADGQAPGPTQVICRLTAHNDGRIAVKPRLGDNYELAAGHNVYHVSVVNAVEGEAEAGETAYEERMRARMQDRQAGLRDHLMGTYFAATPPKGSYRLTILGEILSAEAFPDDGLFAVYRLDPGEWSVASDSPVEGVTQTSLTRTVPNVATGGSTKVAHWCFPLEWELYWEGPPESVEMPPFPRLLLQVSTYDSWDRSRVEGYGHITLPATSGVYTLAVPTWKPQGTIRDQLRSFFVGGSPELADLTEAAVPTDHDPYAPLNKFGFKTVSSGTVRLRLTVVVQRSLPLAASSTGTPKSRRSARRASRQGYAGMSRRRFERELASRRVGKKTR